MKKLIQEIYSGKNIKSNLIKYKSLAVPIYAEYAALELTFSAYTLAQIKEEEKMDIAKKESHVVERIFTLLGELSRGEVIEGMEEQLVNLRQEITDRMDLLMNYMDRYLVYGYVLKRMELRYLPEEELNQRLSVFDDNSYSMELMAYLFSDMDQSVINAKLHELVGQIPVRITKNKFFQQVSEALTLYQGVDRSALDGFIYTIRVAAMVYETNQYAGEYKEFEDTLHRLEETDYTKIEKDTYEELSGLLQEGADQLMELTDFYCSLQQVVNGIYAMCLIHTYQEKESKLIHTCHSIWDALSEGEYADEVLEQLEGRIEEMLEKSSYLETVLFEIRSSYPDELETLGLTSFFEDFAKVASLLSDSMFMNLDQAVQEETADAAYVKKRTEELLAEMAQKFSEVSRPVRRAIMALILEKLPLMFETPEEIEEYIRVNLIGCHDKAEKCAVMTLLWDRMCLDIC